MLHYVDEVFPLRSWHFLHAFTQHIISLRCCQCVFEVYQQLLERCMQMRVVDLREGLSHHLADFHLHQVAGIF